MTELTVTDLAVRRGLADVLNGVSVTVPEGNVLALLGLAGSGKTTLLRAMAGLERPHRGSIRLGDKLLYDAEGRIDLPSEARGLGLVLKSYALWPHRTVLETVGYGLKLRGLARADIKARVSTMLSRLELAHVADRYPHQLSAIEQHRVALGRALIYEPPLVLLDDPLSNLEPKLREKARAWLRYLIVSLKVSTVVVTNDQVEAMALADRIALLNNGSIEQEGSPINLYREPTTLFAAEFMGNNNRLEGILVENTQDRAVIEVKGTRLEGLARTKAAIGEKATGVIRLENVLLGGGRGANRILMSLKAQMYTGERWELLFVTDELSVRTYVAAPLKHALYHIEFPSHALWIF